MITSTRWWRIASANPSDDLLSVLAIGEREGELSREEVLGNTLLLLIAGHQTTINLVGNGTMALMKNPEQWNMLKEDDSLLVRATEELLRYDSPVKRAPRIALEDIELAGQKIREGREGDDHHQLCQPATRWRSRIPRTWTSRATRTRTWLSAAASTTAWARTSPGWKVRRHSVR